MELSVEIKSLKKVRSVTVVTTTRNAWRSVAIPAKSLRRISWTIQVLRDVGGNPISGVVPVKDPVVMGVPVVMFQLVIHKCVNMRRSVA